MSGTHFEDRVRCLRPSSSLVILKNTLQDGGWVSSSPFQFQYEKMRKTFNKESECGNNRTNKDDSISKENTSSDIDGEEAELNVIQQQYLNIKRFIFFKYV